jgi:hypothetical protein
MITLAGRTGWSATSQEPIMHKARLHPHWTAAGYRYSVIFDGKLLIENSRDPECDAARALLKRGYTGQLHMLDGKTGRPRTIIDIEKAAKLTVEEGPNGLLVSVASEAWRARSQPRKTVSAIKGHPRLQHDHLAHPHH